MRTGPLSQFIETQALLWIGLQGFAGVLPIGRSAFRRGRLSRRLA